MSRRRPPERKSAIPPGEALTLPNEPDTNATADAAPGRSGARRERAWVVLLCAVAAVKVLFFSAAFPFFNNVDEQAHYDLVVKYAAGRVPHGFEPYGEEAARAAVLYGSPEFLNRPQDAPGGVLPLPVWSAPPDIQAAILRERTAGWRTRLNHESSHPPLYYAVAGIWYRIGAALGVAGARLLYWVRFFNAIPAAALVWVAYLFGRAMRPGSGLVRLGLPALVAVHPQDLFYGITNDVPSALLGAVALLLLARLWGAERPRPALGAALGLCTAALLLTKISNAPLVAVFAVAAAVRALAGDRARRRPALPALAAGAVAAAVPLALLAAHNLAAFGDLTASREKVRLSDWTPATLDQVLAHPIWRPAGFSYFWTELISTFWRGEFTWHREPLAAPGVDAVYWATSTLFLAAFVWACVTSWRRSRDLDVLAVSSGAVVALAVVSMVVMSVSYDFGRWANPSRELPFFTAGRHMACAIVPFFAMYITGLEALLDRLRLGFVARPLLVAVLALAAGSEVFLTLDPLASAYNWFHLP